jgi:hypothetical protein
VRQQIERQGVSETVGNAERLESDLQKRTNASACVGAANGRPSSGNCADLRTTRPGHKRSAVYGFSTKPSTSNCAFSRVSGDDVLPHMRAFSWKAETDSIECRESACALRQTLDPTRKSIWTGV